jgi:putative two-component system response regulator
MMEQKIYIEEIKNWNINTAISSARLHDVGKIRITDLILNKPGKLTPEEYEMIMTHCTEGELIISEIVSRTSEGPFLHHAKLFAGYHHEKWDGKGYPYGIKGKEIPLQGRIMAIADVYDALVSERPYKKPFSHEQAVEIIKKDSGTHFDPDIVNVFLIVEKDFQVKSLSN